MTPAQPTTKAKSRLQKPLPSATESVQPISSSDQGATIRISSRRSPRSSAQANTSFFEKRRRTMPLLGISILSCAAVLYILTTISPTRIAHILFYQSYLPLLGTVWIALTTLSIFLFNHTRRGVLFGIFCTVLLFLKLQSVVLTPLTILIPFCALLFAELIFRFIFKK